MRVVCGCVCVCSIVGVHVFVCMYGCINTCVVCVPNASHASNFVCTTNTLCLA